MPSRSQGGLALLLPGFLIGVLLALLTLYPTSTRESAPPAPEPYLGSQERPYKALKKARAPNPQPIEKRTPVRLYWAQGKTLTSREIHCLALNIYHEARGEPRTGMVGVGQVTVNRAEAAFMKKTNVCQVVYDHRQFSWSLSPKKRAQQPQGNAWDESLQVARDVAKGLRVHGLEDSLYYHANWIQPPPWSKRMLQLQSIGQHIFLTTTF